MATHSWGGSVNQTSAFTYDNGVGLRTPGVPFPSARLAANGKRPIRVNSITASGGSGTRSYAYYRDGSYRSSGYHDNSGGTFTFRVLKSGGSIAYFGQNTNNGFTSYWVPEGSARTGGMPGSLVYYQSPTAPATIDADTPTPGTIDLTWTAPSDDGGSAITGWRLERATDAAFTVDLVGWDLPATPLTYSDTTATPGQDYYYRIAAVNLVTSNASTFSQWKVMSAGVTPLAGGRRWTGSAEVATVNAKRWNGSAEVDITTAMRWNGSAEVPLS